MNEDELRRALAEAADSIDVPDALEVIRARIAARCPMCDGAGRPGGCLLCRAISSLLPPIGVQWGTWRDTTRCLLRRKSLPCSGSSLRRFSAGKTPESSIRSLPQAACRGTARRKYARCSPPKTTGPVPPQLLPPLPGRSQHMRRAAPSASEGGPIPPTGGYRER